MVKEVCKIKILLQQTFMYMLNGCVITVVHHKSQTCSKNGFIALWFSGRSLSASTVLYRKQFRHYLISIITRRFTSSITMEFCCVDPTGAVPVPEVCGHCLKLEAIEFRMSVVQTFAVKKRWPACWPYNVIHYIQCLFMRAHCKRSVSGRQEGQYNTLNWYVVSRCLLLDLL